MCDHITQESHDCKMVLNKAKLDIKADILVDMPCRIVWLCTENRTYLEDSFKNTHHYLLIELWTLRQVCISPEVVKFEDISSTFCCRCNNLRRLYFCKIPFSQNRAES